MPQAAKESEAAEAARVKMAAAMAHDNNTAAEMARLREEVLQLTGAEIENQPTGAGCYGSHGEQRNSLCTRAWRARMADAWRGPSPLETRRVARPPLRR